MMRRWRYEKPAAEKAGREREIIQKKVPEEKAWRRSFGLFFLY
jgi:hypothetical protein